MSSLPSSSSCRYTWYVFLPRMAMLLLLPLLSSTVALEEQQQHQEFRLRRQPSHNFIRSNQSNEKLIHEDTQHRKRLLDQVGQSMPVPTDSPVLRAVTPPTCPPGKGKGGKGGKKDDNDSGKGGKGGKKADDGMGGKSGKGDEKDTRSGKRRSLSNSNYDDDYKEDDDDYKEDDQCVDLKGKGGKGGKKDNGKGSKGGKGTAGKKDHNGENYHKFDKVSE